ncbi:putative aldose reductase [Cardiosporidium cionae]|uniref:Aldose reductase n=1 Tax=Cardiosporidium cionae TaxID=476202 RepID=A0ABQ7J9A8_9APIC|nr:putative aldose reductase [Cardiosporidium cionae]|eukprot:KAF8820240.1 putative aldose reductase [Cardiosporidium cionae]
MASHLVTLRNGIQMPRLGFGTWQLRDELCFNSVCSALKQGYQLIDTASSYQNHLFVGKALKEAEYKKPAFLFDTANNNNIFVTTKVSVTEMGYEKAYASVIRSLEQLGMDTIDLVLLHFPGASKDILFGNVISMCFHVVEDIAYDLLHPLISESFNNFLKTMSAGSSGVDASSPQNREIRRESWRALEKLYEEKRVRAIGVSNYQVNHLNHLLEDKAVIVPQVNQVELHPFLQNKELEEWAKAHSMYIQSYSTLGSGNAELLENPTISTIAKEVGYTTAQVILRWALHRNFLIIPRSSNVKRIEENFKCTEFSLSEAQVEKISALESGKRYCWNPTKIA